MEFFGVGGWELIAILLIMLMVAGPKRMVHWAYILGRYVGKLRVMWAETMTLIQREFDEAGVGVTLPKEPPTRASLAKAASQVLKPVAEPLKAVREEVETELKPIAAATVLTNGYETHAEEGSQMPSDDASKPDFGTWSQLGKS